MDDATKFLTALMIGVVGVGIWGLISGNWVISILCLGGLNLVNSVSQALYEQWWARKEAERQLEELKNKRIVVRKSPTPSAEAVIVEKVRITKVKR